MLAGTNDDIFLNMDSGDSGPIMRRRSQTWSCSRPSTSNISTGNTEKSIEDIFNEIKQSANEFLESKQKGHPMIPQYEDLSDIEEDTPKNSSPENHYDDHHDEHHKKVDLMEVCGYQTYHQIIEKAIGSAPNGMLTLNQIYRWIEDNIPYFKSLTDAKKSKGWKNSIRHNLSLHKQFYRVIKDGRESFWACDMSRVKHDPKHKRHTHAHIGHLHHSPPSVTSFRPRARTEPTMIKPIRPTNMRAQNEENIQMSESTYPLNFIPMDDPARQKSMETVLRDPIAMFKERYDNNEAQYGSLSADINALKQMDLNRQGSYESCSPTYPINGVNNGFYDPNTMFKYNIFNSTPNLMPGSHQDMNLDIQAIIEHEKHLYEKSGGY